MLDLTIYKSRYYPVKISENETINLEPPKRKQLKKVLELTKNMSNDNLTAEDIDNLYTAASLAFSKNKEGKTFSEDKIDEILDLSSLYAFFEGYYTWVADNVNQKN